MEVYLLEGVLELTLTQYICFHIRKPSFSQGFSDDAHLAKSPEIRFVLTLIYLFLPANTPPPNVLTVPTYAIKRNVIGNLE